MRARLKAEGYPETRTIVPEFKLEDARTDPRSRRNTPVALTLPRPSLSK